jgi:Holliday junction resolvasome RuvABC endonuclease subunit
MQAMVAKLLALTTAPAEDEADALGAAICHLHAGSFHAIVAGATGWGGRTGRGRRAAWRR